jgi:hypothetical protein
MLFFDGFDGLAALAQSICDLVFVGTVRPGCVNCIFLARLSICLSSFVCYSKRNR